MAVAQTDREAQREGEPHSSVTREEKYHFQPASCRSPGERATPKAAHFLVLPCVDWCPVIALAFNPMTSPSRGRVTALSMPLAMAALAYAAKPSD